MHVLYLLEPPSGSRGGRGVGECQGGAQGYRAPHYAPGKRYQIFPKILQSKV